MNPPVLPSAASTRLEALRLFLVAQVMLGHYAMIAYPPFPTLNLSDWADLYVAGYRLVTRFGGEAAFVFVCISGFLLGPRLLASGLNRPGSDPIPQFLKARLRRIYPTLLAAIALTAACDMIAVHLLKAEPLYRRAASYDAIAALNWQAALGNVLSLQPTFSHAFGSNGPLWTLGYIVQFYCAAALLAGCLKRGRLLAGIALAAMLAAGFAWHPEWALLFLCWLGCGAVRRLPVRNRNWGWALLVIGLAAFVAANLMPDPVSVLAAGAAGFCWLAGIQAPLSTREPCTLPKVLDRIAQASFPLYAFHFPLAMLLLAAIGNTIDHAGLVFRIAWPIAAAIPALFLAMVWQKVLPVLLREPRR